MRTRRCSLESLSQPHVVPDWVMSRNLDGVRALADSNDQGRSDWVMFRLVPVSEHVHVVSAPLNSITSIVDSTFLAPLSICSYMDCIDNLGILCLGIRGRCPGADGSAIENRANCALQRQ
jgi:hypothetical protein